MSQWSSRPRARAAENTAMLNSDRPFGVRRIYETSSVGADLVRLRLADRVVELGRKEVDLYHKVVTWLAGPEGDAALERTIGVDAAGRQKLLGRLVEAGLLFERRELPQTVSGEELHREYFANLLPSWLDQAFSHPFWTRMTGGQGSARLFAGWLLELYHYTRNANRHMPLSCAHAREKAIKLLRARHYAEEWNHYHYFMKSLKALGYAERDVAESVPLPMTLALSNFMRQAAREDVLAYSICSAVLEGTTTERGTYSPYYQRCAELYGIPQTAIQPIFAHLDLDVQYGHSDLFLDICKTVDKMPAARAARVLEYGHQLVEHIWLWTDNIERYYESETQPMPRRAFDPRLD
jgi:pyrroloquinoline quinone (PQQ) biosynthesis protein C